MNALRKNPGRWARVKTYESKTSATRGAKNVREQLGAAFEVRAHRHGDGSAVYARFVGDAP